MPFQDWDAEVLQRAELELTHSDVASIVAVAPVNVANRELRVLGQLILIASADELFRRYYSISGSAKAEVFTQREVVEVRYNFVGKVNEHVWFCGIDLYTSFD